ncbi:BnaC01g21420D [Brassica napus]|uniref:BnaC01g21420D protein n=1 Tax=Brassica napus TaxID=3708 RepID=A0A078HB51_BRANA|nr:BnaC01g21420D [Brassica napus]
MSMDPYGGEFQGFGKPCTKSKYSSKYSSGSGFKLITDGVIFQGKNSPRSYSKGYLPSHASHVMIPTLSASSGFC